MDEMKLAKEILSNKGQDLSVAVVLAILIGLGYALLRSHLTPTEAIFVAIVAIGMILFLFIWAVRG